MGALAFLKGGNVAALRRWVGKVGFNEALPHVAKHVTGGDTERAKKVVGKLKGMANKEGDLAPEHAYGQPAKKKIAKGGAEGAEGTPPSSPPSSGKDAAAPARSRRLTGGADMGGPLVPGDHYEPDEDQLGGAFDGDDDNDMKKGEPVVTAPKPLTEMGKRRIAAKNPANRVGPKPTGYVPQTAATVKQQGKYIPQTRATATAPRIAKACGPKSIGTTRSGKDVFGMPSHNAHWKYTADDHDDAARLHEDAGRATQAAQHRHKARKLRSNGHDERSPFAKGTLPKECGGCKKPMTPKDVGHRMCATCRAPRPLDAARQTDLFAQKGGRLSLVERQRAFMKGGGEGSRGGSIIGHTKSGKAIYSNVGHRGHANFTRQDHYDAAEAHDNVPDASLHNRESAKGHRFLAQQGTTTHPGGSADPEGYQAKIAGEPKARISRAPKKPKSFAERLQGTLDKQRKRHEDSAAAMQEARARAAARTGEKPATSGPVNIMDMIGKGMSLFERQRAFVKGGGEGSRGGQIMGHTRSGKPVYAHPNHPAHANFSPADHMDAAAMHEHFHNVAATAHAGGEGLQHAATHYERGKRPQGQTKKAAGWKAHLEAADEAVHGEPAEQYRRGQFEGFTAADHDQRAQAHHSIGKAAHDYATESHHSAMTPSHRQAMLKLADNHFTHASYHDGHAYRLRQQEQRQKSSPRGQLRAYMNREPGAKMPGTKPPPIPTAPGGQGNLFARKASLFERQRAFLKGGGRDFSKARHGEGSRGGKIIGHTRSGKPIYDRHDHPAHAGFSQREHHEAAEAHRDASRDLADSVKQSRGGPSAKRKAQMVEHTRHAEHHVAAGREADELARLSPGHEHFKERTAGFSPDDHKDAIEYHHARVHGKPMNSREHAHAANRDWHQAALGPDEWRPMPVSQMKEGDTYRHYTRGTNEQEHHRITRVDHQEHTGMRTLHTEHGQKIVDDHKRTGDDPLLEGRPRA